MANEPTSDVLVALTPAEMVPAQQGLIAWCDKKIQSLSDEADELELHQKLALENGWKTSVVVASINRTARRIAYYKKMQTALHAGYLLVPNMPVNLLAVRVNREKQPATVHDSRWRGFAATLTNRSSMSMRATLSTSTARNGTSNAT